jgi:hypothetical protein
MSCEDARAIALSILECAAASESDLFLVGYAEERIELTTKDQQALLDDHKRWKSEKRGI